MDIDVAPAKYVVAVSGGVDSMVLLDLLVNQSLVARRQSPVNTEDRRLMTDDPSLLQLVVAHFDHGIRADSGEDRKLVRAAAEHYNLPFEYEEGKLGPQASEADARTARYAFLERVKAKYDAQAIITAHHRDDLLETAILNILRGTGRKGLTSLTSRPDVLRPLLAYSKQEILTYAKRHDLKWREDSTNHDDAYLRNYVRHHIISRLSLEMRGRLLWTLRRVHRINRAVDAELASLSQLLAPGTTLDRRAFAALPHSVAKELLATWLRRQGIADFDRKTLERVTIAAKTKPAGMSIDILHGNSLFVGKAQLALRICER